MKEHLDYAERVRTTRRMQVVVALFSATFLAYGADLWYHQVLQGARYQSDADHNFLRQQEIVSYRGHILDREKRVLVSNRLSFNVMLDRERLRDADRLSAFLSGVLMLSPEVIEARLEQVRTQPIHQAPILAEDVSIDQAVSIEARRLEWPELSIAVVPRRAYPQGSLAAHVLGYVGEISQAEIRSGRFSDLGPGDIVGKTGIERVYQRELQGVKGQKRVMVNSRGRIMEEVGTDSLPVHGREIVLTLDLALQQALEAGLEPHVGAAVFLDPWSGEILALASSPAFQPDLFARHFPVGEWEALIGDPRKPLQNRATLSRFSPGSIFKLVVAAAGLEEGIITARTSIFCGGSVRFYGRRFHCHKVGGHGEVALEEALIHSCNVYFYTVGKELGIEQIAAYARRLGLGEATGIDLMAEEQGLVPTPEWKRATRDEPWYGGETVIVAIGGGPIGVTPIQMARMAASLANGGRRVTPHLHHRGGAKERHEVERQRGEIGFSRATIGALRAAMTGVVSRGTGGRAGLKSLQVAAKTGTAQYSSLSAGVDADDLPYEIRDHAWMIGFAPAEEPRIAFAVFIEHGGHGGTTAAPVVRRALGTFFDLPWAKELPVSRPVQEVGHAAAP